MTTAGYPVTFGAAVALLAQCVCGSRTAEGRCGAAAACAAGTVSQADTAKLVGFLVDPRTPADRQAATRAARATIARGGLFRDNNGLWWRACAPSGPVPVTSGSALAFDEE